MTTWNVNKIIIDADRAAELLTLNTKNYRKVSDAQVSAYAKLMLEGKWDGSISTITVDWNNVLQNGQHRLLAILRSGVAIETVLISNVNPASRTLHDTHMPRRMKDHLCCAPWLITMVNVFLRSEGLHITQAKNQELYRNHVEGKMGKLTKELHGIHGGVDDPFTSMGVRAGIVLAIMNGKISKKDGLAIFRTMIKLRRHAVKCPIKGTKVYKSQLNMTERAEVVVGLTPLMGVLCNVLEAGKLPTYVGNNKWANENYVSARDKAQKLMYAVYQAIDPDTKDNKKFDGPLSNVVRGIIGKV